MEKPIREKKKLINIVKFANWVWVSVWSVKIIVLLITNITFPIPTKSFIHRREMNYSF